MTPLTTSQEESERVCMRGLREVRVCDGLREVQTCDGLCGVSVGVRWTERKLGGGGGGLREVRVLMRVHSDRDHHQNMMT